MVFTFFWNKFACPICFLERFDVWSGFALFICIFLHWICSIFFWIVESRLFCMFFQFVHFFFRTFFCKFAISKQDLWESWKNTGKLQNKKMRKTCKTNATKIAKNAKQAKKTLKLETKTLFLHVFFGYFLIFLGVCRVFLGFSRFLIPSKEALGILKQHAQKCEKRNAQKCKFRMQNEPAIQKTCKPKL